MMIKGLLLYILSFSLLVVSYAFAYLNAMAPVALLILLVGVIIQWKKDGLYLDDLGFRRDAHSVKRLGLGFIIGLIIPFSFVFLEVGVSCLVLVAVTPSVSLFVIGIIRIVLVVAVEEIVFRGYFMQRLVISENPWGAVFLSSILWSCLHIPSMVHSGLSIVPLLVGVGSFVLIGIALGLAFLYSGKSLWVPFGIHLGYNSAFSLIGTFFTGSYSAPSFFVGTPPWTPESGILGVLLGTMILVVVLLLRPAYEDDTEK